MPSLHVDLGPRSYPIHIGSGLLADPELFLPHCNSGPIAILSDDRVAGLHLPALRQTLKEAGKPFTEIVVPAGEESKSLHRVEEV